VEVTDLEQLRGGARAAADRIMLDNMPLDVMAKPSA
jgi:nicotinate-nucleotide pyrophosphorylase